MAAGRCCQRRSSSDWSGGARPRVLAGSRMECSMQGIVALRLHGAPGERSALPTAEFLLAHQRRAKAAVPTPGSGPRPPHAGCGAWAGARWRWR